MAAPMKQMKSLVLCAIAQYSRTILTFRSRHALQNNAYFSLSHGNHRRITDATILSSIIPTKLKRPGNSYGLFLADVRAQLTAEHSDKSFKEISQMLGNMWKELPEPEKEQYRERAEKIRSEFKQQFEYYKANLTENHIRVLLEMERTKLRRRKLRKGKQEMKELDKPKRFSGPFAFYARAKLSELKAEGAIIRKAPLADVSLDWNVMDEEDKYVYKELAKEDMVRYRKEMDEWEQRMEAEGRYDLLRKKKAHRKEQENDTDKNDSEHDDTT
ncbi:transcription factor A, mitochondrial-like [Antedon mediterranea]|uniref:transcription factor A, mitochondrial-like n=1 Tax=Antedon mediterranea TaxID=105859 RepID=UPI003AF7D71F